MKFLLKYGKTIAVLSLSDKLEADIICRKADDYLKVSEAEIIQQALAEASLPLGDFVSPSDSVAIIVSDQTRPTGSEVYLKILIDELMTVGVTDISVILAQGFHRAATEPEIEKIFGGSVPDGVRVINHDAESGLKKKGEASFRSEAVDADKVIITGAVTFHPMAGFSGGRKSLLPGIASAEDIRKNHRLYFKNKKHNPECGPGLVKNNPVRDDLNARTAGFSELWALNVVLGESKDIIFASCGDADGVWNDCVKWVSARFSFELKEQYDTVISSAGGYPSDFSFYQSMKVLTNSVRACKEGGRLIILSECSNGWEIDSLKLGLFQRSLSEVAEILIEDFRMDVLGIYMAMSIIRRYDVWLNSSLPRDEVEAAGMHYLADTSMIEALAADGRTAVIKNGSSILPISEKQRKELL